MHDLIWEPWRKVFLNINSRESTRSLTLYTNEHNTFKEAPSWNQWLLRPSTKIKGWKPLDFLAKTSKGLFSKLIQLFLNTPRTMDCTFFVIGLRLEIRIFISGHGSHELGSSLNSIMPFRLVGNIPYMYYNKWVMEVYFLRRVSHALYMWETYI